MRLITRAESPELVGTGNSASRPSGASPGTFAEPTISLLIFIVALAYLCVVRRYSSLEPDEGIVLQGAERILRGEVPYRDFFSFYTPGSFYLVAFLFRIFGDSFTVARTSLAVTGAGCSLITYVLARRVCSRRIALFAAALATIAGVAYRFLVLHNWYSTLLSCLAIYAAVRLLESRKPPWAFATGSFVSLTLLFEQSKGAGLFLGLSIGFLALHILGREDLFRRIESMGLVGGFAWPFVLTAGYFGAQHSVKVMLEDWIWPLHHYTQANHVPYGWQNWSDHSRDLIFHAGPAWLKVTKVLAVSPGFLVPALPLIAVGLFAYWSAAIWSQKEVAARSTYYVIVCAGVSGLLVSVVIVRADIIHFMYLAPLLYVVLAWILDGRDLPGRALALLRPYLAVYVGVGFGLMGLAVLLTATGARNTLETRRGRLQSSGRETVIEYVQAHVPPGNDILVYPYLPLYNYLTETRSPSRYDYFQTGMNTPEQAQEIIASLDAHQVRSVLFEPWFAEKIANSWPGTPLGAIARDPVADYIVQNYRACKALKSASDWRFQYMVRKEVACP